VLPVDNAIYETNNDYINSERDYIDWEITHFGEIICPQRKENNRGGWVN
jgi:hypothetical protein